MKNNHRAVMALLMAVAMMASLMLSASALDISVKKTAASVGVPKTIQNDKLDPSVLPDDDARKPFVGKWRMILGVDVNGNSTVIGSDAVTCVFYNDGSAETYSLGKLNSSYNYDADGSLYKVTNSDEGDKDSKYGFSEDGNTLYFYMLDTDKVIFGYERIA